MGRLIPTAAPPPAFPSGQTQGVIPRPLLVARVGVCVPADFGGVLAFRTGSIWGCISCPSPSEQIPQFRVALDEQNKELGEGSLCVVGVVGTGHHITPEWTRSVCSLVAGLPP